MGHACTYGALTCETYCYQRLHTHTHTLLSQFYLNHTRYSVLPSQTFVTSNLQNLNLKTVGLQAFVLVPLNSLRCPALAPLTSFRPTLLLLPLARLLAPFCREACFAVPVPSGRDP